jgi:glycosyltransferase involved in cell wall biosynthesis
MASTSAANHDSPSPEQFDELVDQLAVAREDLREAEGEVQQLRRELQRSAARLERESYQAALSGWRLESFKARRAIRLAAALRGASRSRRAAARLPREVAGIFRRRPIMPPRPDPPGAASTDDVAAARKALDVGDYEAAIARADSAVARDPDNLVALGAKREAQVRRGDLSAAVRTLYSMRLIDRGAGLAEQERSLIGRLVETDPRWLPRIPAPSRPVVPWHPDRIMHVLKESVPYHHNGFCMRSQYSLRAQREAGLDPFAVTSLGFPRKDGITDFSDVEVVDGIMYHRLDLGPSYPEKGPFDQYLTDFAWMAAKVAAQEGPAIIHAGSGFRGYETALVGLALREHLQLPLVYEVRSFFETTWTGELARAERGEHFQRRYDAENRCMRQADAVITIAEAMRAEIVARGVPAERVFVVPNGVAADTFTPREADPALRAKYRLGGRPVFGYVSNLDHAREGQELLVEATARLRSRGREMACLIVGDGRRRPELERLAASLGVSDLVVFTGAVPHSQIQRYYALIDVFVVPRRPERAARLVTPLKPLEAMALGRPVVVSELPPLVEITDPDERGLSFPPEDAHALAATIERLVDNPALRHRIADAGRRWVIAERSWSANGPRYREVYDFVRAAHRPANGRLIGSE